MHEHSEVESAGDEFGSVPDGDAGADPSKSEDHEQSEGEMTIEGRLRRLDEIVVALEADDVGLDRGLELFEEGVRHVRSAERVLADAELKVEELIGEETRPWSEETE